MYDGAGVRQPTVSLALPGLNGPTAGMEAIAEYRLHLKYPDGETVAVRSGDRPMLDPP
jgi:hypothetical protein